MRQAIIAVVMLAVPRAVLACPVCFGQNDSPLAGAINNGVIAMLGVVVVVLSGFAAFIVHLNRRARLVAAGESGPTQIEGSRVSSSTPQEGTAQC
jgi:hypothetical protein